jgi:hypothetical protein
MHHVQLVLVVYAKEASKGNNFILLFIEHLDV